MACIKNIIMENVRIFKSIYFNYLHLLDMISRLEQVRSCAPLGLNHPKIQCELTGLLSGLSSYGET